MPMCIPELEVDLYVDDGVSVVEFEGLNVDRSRPPR